MTTSEPLHLLSGPYAVEVSCLVADPEGGPAHPLIVALPAGESHTCTYSTAIRCLACEGAASIDEGLVRLQAVATDDELDLLDLLARRAGIERVDP